MTHFDGAGADNDKVLPIEDESDALVSRSSVDFIKVRFSMEMRSLMWLMVSG